MNTLVLGGTQFIGLALVKELLAKGHHVTILNRGQSQADLPAEVQRLRADRNDSDSMRSALQGLSYDAVFDVSGYTEAHIQGVLDALEGQMGHFLFTSSTAIYFGSLIYPIREEDTLMPDDRGGSYAWNKILGERLLARWSDSSGIPYSVIRPAYVYGGGTNTPGREPAYFYRLENNLPLLLPTRGIPLAHLVHVEDIAQLFIQCLGNPRAYGQAYNGAGPDFTSLRGWFMAMAQAVGVEPKIISVPDDLTPEMRTFPFQTRRCVIYSLDKCIRDLDYKPKYDTSTGLTESYQRYKQELSGSFTCDLSEDDALIAEIQKRA